MVANAVSLGTGEYLSSLAQREFMQVERRRETWQLKHFKDAEIKEVRLSRRQYAEQCRLDSCHELYVTGLRNEFTLTFLSILCLSVQFR